MATKKDKFAAYQYIYFIYETAFFFKGFDNFVNSSRFMELYSLYVEPALIVSKYFASAL